MLAAVLAFKLMVEPTIQSAAAAATAIEGELPGDVDSARRRAMLIALGQSSGGAAGDSTELTRLVQKPAAGSSTAGDYVQRRIAQLARTPISQIAVRDI